MGIKKGQKVWVWQDRCGTTETTIKTIGRKYITLEYPYNMKFNIDDLKENDYRGLAAFIILDLEEYKKECHYNKFKIKLRRINWDKVKQADLDKIEQIMKEYFEGGTKR